MIIKSLKLLALAAGNYQKLLGLGCCTMPKSQAAQEGWSTLEEIEGDG